MWLSTVILLAQWATLSLSTPLPATLSPRAQYCANAPSTIAGTLLPRDPSSTSPLLPRDPPSIIWCAPNSAVYILLTPVLSPSDGPSLLSLLTTASGYLATHIHELGDSLIARGRFEMSDPGGALLRTWNANNHQQTWGTLLAAVDALRDYMRVNGGAGARFGIFDGQHLVGEGVVGGG